MCSLLDTLLDTLLDIVFSNCYVMIDEINQVHRAERRNLGHVVSLGLVTSHQALRASAAR